ncbi:MAG: SpoIIE family protein phosphatase [Bacteroidales bacterium]|nr:SpoIIE family protein phosphatase [Bacteroidales bacterium]MBN2756182.1 SpoIIE family protein phosphatase [Bacteroidales bacterium]
MLVWILLISNLVYSQQYNFINYTIDDGLPGSTINSIFEDSRGFLWVGTNNGLTKFDGKTWKIFSLPEELSFANVQSIFEDKNTNIWIGTKNHGLFMFDGVSAKKYSNDFKFENINIVSICEDENGNILIASNNKGIFVLYKKDLIQGIIKLSKDVLLNLTIKNTQINAMIKDSDGSIWVATNKGLYKKKGKNIKKYTLYNGLPHNKVLNIFEDNLKRIWFSTPRGVVRYNFNNFSVFKTQDGLLSNEVTSIGQDNNGNIWFGSDLGINIFDGSSFKYITEQNGLSDNHISCLKLDDYGDVWIGTEFGGLNKFAGYMISRLTSIEGLNNNKIFALSTDFEGKLYIATLDGLEQLDFNKKDNFKLKKILNTSKLKSKIIQCIFVDSENRKWIGTNNGLLIYHKNQLQHINISDTINITTIYEDINKNILIGTNKNLIKLHFEDFQNINSYSINIYDKKNNLPESPISSVYQDFSGKIWIAYRKNGLYYSDTANYFTPFNKEKINNITIIKADKNNKIWIGTETNGIFILKSKKNQESEIINNIKVENGLISNRINSLLFLDESNIIIGSNRGIDKITIDKNFKIKRNIRLGKSEGFKQIETTERAIDNNSEGTVFIGSLDGLIVYNKFEENPNQKPPKTHITSIKLFFKPINWKKSDYCKGTTKWFNLPENLILPSNQNHVTFKFLGVNLKPQVKTYYQWKLSPKDKDWSPPIENTEITFSDLSSGNYTFLVRAYNEKGSADIDSFDFIIQTPIHKTLWFITLALLLLATLIMLSMKYRTRKLIKTKEILEEQVRLRTVQLLKEKEIVEEKNIQIVKQTEELETQRDSLFEINELLQNQNRDITDSINYAKTIQSAVLGPKDSIKDIFEKSFIFYLPKDIVSGDFYWFSKQNDKAFIAAADCTGHGVPGAFMSIIGHSLIKEILNNKQNLKASEILFQLDKGVIDVLTLHKKEDSSKDGMDLALCKIDLKKNQINFSGAKRPIYYFNRELDEIEVIKGDRIGIGDEYFYKEKPNYKDHFINYKKGDRIFLFSDGFIDQFGGDNEKKFLGRRFQKLLFLLKDTDIQKHESILQDVFKEWKGKKNEQADDILIIGIEF